MCVICYTNKTQISNKDIKKMFEENPDGAGFAYIDNNGIAHYHKGFMTVESLISSLPKDRRYLMLHFRIATSGEKNEIMTHPFNINNPESTEGITDRIIMHNGIIPVSWDVSKEDKKNYSDTFLFCRDILSTLDRKNAIDFALTVNYSRFAIYDKNLGDRWMLYGKWDTYKGMDVSNLNFNLPPKVTYGGWNSGVTGTYYKWPRSGELDYADMWDDDREQSEYIKAKKEPKNDDSFDEINPELCMICGEKMTDAEDITNGICEECTYENGLICACGARLDSTNYNSGMCWNCERLARGDS